MRVFAIFFPVFFVALTFLTISDAEARKKTVRGALYCQGDHLHYGSSGIFRKKRHAMRDAIESWAGFTVFEYGAEWGHWRLSINKKVDCKKGADGWSCSIQSTPCRKAKRGEKGKYR